MMDSVVWPVASPEVGVNALASLSPVPIGDLIIEFREAPCLLDQFLLTVASALTFLPSCGIHSLSDVTPLCLQQSGLMVHALVLQTACIVKTQGITPRNVFRFQFFFFHNAIVGAKISNSLFSYTSVRNEHLPVSLRVNSPD